MLAYYRGLLLAFLVETLWWHKPQASVNCQGLWQMYRCMPQGPYGFPFQAVHRSYTSENQSSCQAIFRPKFTFLWLRWKKGRQNPTHPLLNWLFSIWNWQASYNEAKLFCLNGQIPQRGWKGHPALFCFVKYLMPRGGLDHMRHECGNHQRLIACKQ